MTTAVIDEGLKQLRAASIGTTVYADPSESPSKGDSAVKVGQHTAFFWRGVRDKTVSKEFMENGGSDLGCMSTSASKEVAASFAKSDCPLIFRFVTNDFMQRGADVSFLSVYPHEQGVLYPPLTRLKPLGPMRAEVKKKEQSETTGQEIWNVERLVGYDKKKRLYLVKWEGFPSSKNIYVKAGALIGVSNAEKKAARDAAT